MPSNDILNQLASSPWYNDVKNPAARKTVYEDSPTEYTFLVIGDDWTSITYSEEDYLRDDASTGGGDSTDAGDSTKQRRRPGLLGRAAKWVRRRL